MSVGDRPREEFLSMCLNKSYLFAIAFAFSLTTCQAKGDIILGNLPGNSGTAASFNELTFGVEFKTGSSNLSLDSATLVIRQLPSVGVQVSINAFNASNHTTPGAELARLNSPTLSDLSPQSEVFSASQPITLLANTDYWLVLKANPGDFGYAFGSTTAGSAATYVGDYFDNPFFAANSGIPAFQLNGVAVAEPSSMVLIGVAGLFGLIRRVKGQA